MAVGKEGVGEGDAWVEVLADKEIAVVESGGVEADEEFLGSGLGERYFFELKSRQIWVVSELYMRNVDERFWAYG